MHKKMPRIAAAALLAAGAFLAMPAQATLLDWTISGPGTISATQTGADSWDMSYNQPGYGSTRTWVVSSVASADGDYSFDYEFKGFHSWYEAQAGLTATQTGGGVDTLVSPGTSVSGGFDFLGSYTFDNTHAGDILSFTITGYNWDSSAIVTGDLILTQTSETDEVPEPASLALAGLGLAGLAFKRRKRA